MESGKKGEAEVDQSQRELSEIQVERGSRVGLSGSLLLMNSKAYDGVPARRSWRGPRRGALGRTLSTRAAKRPHVAGLVPSPSSTLALAQSQRYQPFLLSALAALVLVFLLFLADSYDPLLPHPRQVTTMAPPTILSQFLDSSKAAFLADVAAGKTLENWVISVGNEAGGVPSPALPPQPADQLSPPQTSTR